MPLKISPNHYLEGPQSRWKEFLFTIRVMWQFIKAFRKLHFAGPCVTVFGSARFKEDHPYYQQGMEVGKLLASMGFTTMTGGGPGIMEAANRGAFENGGKSIGCTIELPMEQTNNPYMHTWIPFEHFFIRKVLLLKYSYAFFVLPGGWGTMDELFETLTLIQTYIIQNFPVILMGKAYFSPLWDYLHYMVENKTISKEDMKFVLFTDDLDEARVHIEQYIVDNYKIKKRQKRFWFLGE